MRMGQAKPLKLSIHLGVCTKFVEAIGNLIEPIPSESLSEEQEENADSNAAPSAMAKGWHRALRA
jgi:hypothetical protein